MKLLINGICRSRGPGSWPYFLQAQLGCNLVNLSIAGSGGAYIHETTISELSKRSYDLVIVMWNTSHHVSVKVNNINKYSDSTNTSLYQSNANDWPEKIVEPLNDQDYVEKNWILGVGQYKNLDDSVAQFYSNYFDAVKFKQSVESDIIRVISLQSFLKSRNQPYVFLYSEKHQKWKQFEHLYNQIDWSNWYQDITLEDIANEDNGRLKSDDPGLGTAPEGHEIYAELLVQHINNKVINDSK